MWGTVPSFRREWLTIVRSLISGNYRPIVTRAVLFGDANRQSVGRQLIVWPAVILDEVGGRNWGLIQQPRTPSDAFLRAWQLRDLLTIKNTPSSISVVSDRDGSILWQNASSMAMFGEGSEWFWIVPGAFRPLWLCSCI